MLEAFLNEVRRLIPQADDELPPGSIAERLGDAVRAYSRISPRLLAFDYAGDSSTYEYTLPVAWCTDFSRVRSIEYPVGHQEPVYLVASDYVLYRTPDGLRLRLFITPATGEMLRVLFTALHSLNSLEDTIPDRDSRVVACLAAAYVARNLAGKYAGFTDPSLVADVIPYRTKQREYSNLADQWETQFKLHFGMGQRDLSPAAGNWGKIELGLDERYGVTPP